MQAYQPDDLKVLLQDSVVDPMKTRVFADQEFQRGELNAVLASPLFATNLEGKIRANGY